MVFLKTKLLASVSPIPYLAMRALDMDRLRRKAKPAIEGSGFKDLRPRHQRSVLRAVNRMIEANAGLPE